MTTPGCAQTACRAALRRAQGTAQGSLLEPEAQASLSSGLNACPATTHGCHAGTRLPGSKSGSSSQSRKEAGNEVELKKDEWNVLVELIRTGS